jgi:hypothetical protein
MSRHQLAEKLYTEYIEGMNLLAKQIPQPFRGNGQYPHWHDLSSEVKSVWERVADVAVTAFPAPERN